MASPQLRIFQVRIKRNSTVAWHRQKNRHSTDRQDGIVALEFVILFPLFMLILVGIMEFGHLFYVRHTLTNASREGARAAVLFHEPQSSRISWAQAQATTTVNDYLNNRLPGVKWTVPTPEVSGGTTGSTVKVTINATDVSMVLGKLLSAFQKLSVSAQTTMKME
jgi:Flp pilus assembly protein TadG